MATDNLIFLDLAELEAIHTDQLEKHGGQDGYIDQRAVESAMMRARNTAAYVEDADLADLAAEYFYGLSTTQGFLDGNKRTALVAASVFLRKNGFRMTITDELMYVLAMGVANSDVDKERLARILRDHMVELE